MPPDSGLVPFTTVFRADDSHRIRRNRQPVSCVACQRRKTRCNRSQPCDSCEKRGDGSRCRFGTPSADAAGGGSGTMGGSVGGAGSKRDAAPRKGGVVTAASSLEAQARLSRLEELVKGLAEGSRLRNTTAVMGADSSSGYTDREVEGRAPPGHMLADGDETAYRGATSWTTVVESIRDLQHVLENGRAEEPSESPDFPPTPTGPDVVLGDLPPISLTDILDTLPPRPQADHLISAYFNARFICPIYLHAHVFRRQYEAFWAEPSSSGYLWISILFSVLSSAAMMVRARSAPPPPGVEPCSREQQRAWMHRSAQCLVAGDYLKTKALSVEALLMHALARNLQSEDSDSVVWSLSSLAVRMAQRKGYHRDAGKVSSKFTPFEAEMRRRVWFVCQAMDLLLSSQHGLPPTVYDEVCDVGHPTNLTDDDFDEDTILLPQPRSQSDPHPPLAYHLKSRVCSILRRVIHQALYVVPVPHSQSMALSDELEQWYASIPPCLRIRPIRSTSFTDPTYTIMHRVMLELMYRRALILVHRPYLTAENKPSAERCRSRDMCRDAALRLVDLHIDFDREIQPGGRLYDDRYTLSSLAMHDFLIAAMVLSLDLSEFPDTSSQDRERQIQSLREAQRIWTARSTHSMEALHASRVLRAILNKVDSKSASASDASMSVPRTPNHGVPPQASEPSIKDTGLGEPQLQDTFQYQLFGDTMPIDDFIDHSDGLGWDSIDQYLRFDSAVPPWS